MIPEHTYRDPDIASPFCSGCGHEMVLKSLDKALLKLNLDPRRVVIVTDIGCVGLLDRQFVTHAFHGLHGRSVTYGTGLKLANPNLTVIVLIGDGGCGIGGTHIVNAARRNIGITLLVCNNFNYGMTGGQHSVATPLDGKTLTTRTGNIEAPLDICALALAGRGSWVGRSIAHGNQETLLELLSTAIAHDGFSLLDIWEVCPGHYVKRNDVKPTTLKE